MSGAAQPAVTYPGPHCNLAKIYFENVSATANSGLEAVHAAGIAEGIRLARGAVEKRAAWRNWAGDWRSPISFAQAAIDAIGKEAANE